MDNGSFFSPAKAFWNVRAKIRKIAILIGSFLLTQGEGFLVS
jgi:hypothetical protein